MAPARSCRIALRASLVAQVGAPVVVLDLPGDAVAQDVRRAVAAAHPDAAPLLERALVVAGDRILDADAALPEETEIALVPPVSGG